METDQPRWFYVGDGKLRLKNGDGWTDEYQVIESPRAKGTQTTVLEPDPRTLQGTKPKSHFMKWLAVCTSLVVLGGTGAAFATGSLNLDGLGSFVSASGLGTTPDQAEMPTGSSPAAASFKPGSAWNGGGYAKADYAKRVGAIPVWVRDIRRDSGDALATRVDLMGLGFQFDAVGAMPAPPKIDPTWWAATNASLSKLSHEAADKWAGGNQSAAKANLETVIKSSNTMITKVNAAFGLQIATSKTTA
ncbi:MAG: hypothetical protein ABI474_04475 [Actinomycetota bacterium]